MLKQVVTIALVVLLAANVVIASEWREDQDSLSEASARLDQTRGERAALVERLAGTREEAAREAARAQATAAALDEAADAFGETAARLNETAARLDETRARLEAREDASLELAAQRAAYEALQDRYADAVARQHGTLASIQDGNVTWHFTTEDGEEHAWRFDLEDYKRYALRERPDDYLVLPSDGGPQMRVADPRPYVTPEVFAPYVGDLTEGRDARQFVRDAFRVKGEFVVYGFSLADQGGLAYKYPAETLTEGKGICGDTTILLASLLLAGEAREQYGLKLKLWIVKWEDGRIVDDPPDVNHALLEVEFADGERWYLETTSRTLYQHATMHGWTVDVPGSEPTAVPADG